MIKRWQSIHLNLEIARPSTRQADWNMEVLNFKNVDSPAAVCQSCDVSTFSVILVTVPLFGRIPGEFIKLTLLLDHVFGLIGSEMVNHFRAKLILFDLFREYRIEWVFATWTITRHSLSLPVKPGFARFPTPAKSKMSKPRLV